MSYVLVGEAPSAAAIGRPERWLNPEEPASVANRAMLLLGWTPKRFCEVFPVRTNLWDNPRRRWPALARVRVTEVKSKAINHDGIVVIGRLAADAFGLGKWPPLTWSGEWTRPIALLPYPSGRCYFWKDPAHVAKAKEFFSRCASQLQS